MFAVVVRCLGRDAVLLLGEETEQAADSNLFGSVDFGSGTHLDPDAVEEDLNVRTLKRLELG
jgi:hypothetical protein